MSDTTARERSHQDAWYTRAIRDRFFEREGFRRLVSWNLACLRGALPLTSTSRVLSLGCGAGDYELKLAALVGHVHGIDLSAVAVAEARARAQALALVNVEFSEASVLEVTMPEASFDVVYALGVLHHLTLAERHALLIRVRRWLAPGGWFYARDPNARGLLRRAAASWFRHSDYHSPNESALDPTALRQELLAAGFQDPEIGFTDVLAGPLPWLVSSSSRMFWSAIFAFDRGWLAIPGLRTLASQFDIRASP
jgi:SAM-dependent methyltransferase